MGINQIEEYTYLIPCLSFKTLRFLKKIREFYNLINSSS